MRVLCAYQLGSQINLFDLNIQLDWMSAFEDLKTYYTRQKNPPKMTPLLCLEDLGDRRHLGKKILSDVGWRTVFIQKPRDEMKDEG